MNADSDMTQLRLLKYLYYFSEHVALVWPLQRSSRILSILIALVAVTFTGILVALAVNATSLSLRDLGY